MLPESLRVVSDQRYMHLAPGETHRAIRILDGSEVPLVAADFGDILETGVVPTRKVND